jgi:hypothetical protein
MLLYEPVAFPLLFDSSAFLLAQQLVPFALFYLASKFRILLLAALELLRTDIDDGR